MQTVDFLSQAEDFFKAGKANSAMRSIFCGLAEKRKELSGDAWKGFVAQARKHPALKTALLCPLTYHAATRPAGYPGDAGLIDHIYGYAKPEVDKLTQSIYAYTTGAPASRAVRFRRHILASLVDKTLHEKDSDTNILAVACGHLRELDASRNLSHVRPNRFIALDQDANSLAEVERCFGKFGVTIEKRNIKNIVVGRSTYEGLDLVYSAGLYDYLSAEVAQRLTYNLFNMLAPKSTLLTANFLPNIQDVGFMEAAMDWWLIYRDEKDMLALLTGIPESEIESIRQYRDPDDNITFLEVRKK
jgi:extracellular factor (EF) 3-hydroxypalmitic acid methyl ester biosynthesis protein